MSPGFAGRENTADLHENPGEVIAAFEMTGIRSIQKTDAETQWNELKAVSRTAFRFQSLANLASSAIIPALCSTP